MTFLDIIGVLVLFWGAVLGINVVIGTKTGGFGLDAGPVPVFNFKVTNEGVLYVIDILSSSVFFCFCFSRTWSINLSTSASEMLTLVADCAVFVGVSILIFLVNTLGAFDVFWFVSVDAVVLLFWAGSEVWTDFGAGIVSACLGAAAGSSVTLIIFLKGADVPAVVISWGAETDFGGSSSLTIETPLFHWPPFISSLDN